MAAASVKIEGASESPNVETPLFMQCSNAFSSTPSKHCEVGRLSSSPVIVSEAAAPNFALSTPDQSYCVMAVTGPGEPSSSSASSVPQPVKNSELMETRKPAMSEDANIAAADSNSSSKQFVPCKVCGDKASGYHYGVTSCEGCKGFFRRSIQKQIEYRCLRDGKCLVIRLNRNRCQYCRFKKCLVVGMSRDSVRYGRVPKRSRSQDEQVSTTAPGVDVAGGGGGVSSEEESRQLALYDVILSVSQAHHANCSTTEDRVKAIVRKPYSLMTKQEQSAVVPSSVSDVERCQMLQNLAALITPSIQSVVEFAKRLPDFHALGQDDQLVLIKSGFFEMWLSHVSRMFDHNEHTLTFDDGSIVPFSQLQLIYSHDLTEAMFRFADNFCQLQLTDTEIGLFTGVVLATPDRIGVTNTSAVRAIATKLSDALRLQITRARPCATDPLWHALHARILPQLHAVGALHARRMAVYQRGPLTPLPPLYAELYDMPKLDEADAPAS